MCWNFFGFFKKNNHSLKDLKAHPKYLLLNQRIVETLQIDLDLLRSNPNLQSDWVNNHYLEINGLDLFNQQKKEKLLRIFINSFWKMLNNIEITHHSNKEALQIKLRNYLNKIKRQIKQFNESWIKYKYVILLEYFLSIALLLIFLLILSDTIVFHAISALASAAVSIIIGYLTVRAIRNQPLQIDEMKNTAQKNCWLYNAQFWIGILIAIAVIVSLSVIMGCSGGVLTPAALFVPYAISLGKATITLSFAHLIALSASWIVNAIVKYYVQEWVMITNIKKHAENKKTEKTINVFNNLEVVLNNLENPLEPPPFMQIVETRFNHDQSM